MPCGHQYLDGCRPAALPLQISHAFDDSGRKFDVTGTLRDWWTPTSAAAFRNRTACFVTQYSAYSPPQSPLHVNGNLTLGENLADAGGIRAAYAAYRDAAAANTTATSGRDLVLVACTLHDAGQVRQHNLQQP